MKRSRLLLLAALLILPAAALSAPTQNMPDQAKKNFAIGGFQVMASACTGAGAPSPCCTGAGAGATCPTYKLALITNAGTCATSTTTWSSISANEVGASGTYSAGGATLSGMSIGISANHAQVSFTSPVSWTSATITARAGVIYCSANCPTLDVVGCYCLDGGSCAADTSSTSGTFSVTLPTGVYAIN